MNNMKRIRRKVRLYFGLIKKIILSRISLKVVTSRKANNERSTRLVGRISAAIDKTNDSSIKSEKDFFPLSRNFISKKSAAERRENEYT